MRNWWPLKKQRTSNQLWRRYQLGIYNRYARESEGWQSHLERSKQRIIDFTERHSLQTITILGSGWLLDVPLGELTAMCKHVTLIDRYHPRQAAELAHQYKNVEILKCDITNGLESLKLKNNNWEQYVQQVKALQIPSIPTTEGVVSLNLLSQLAMPIQELYADSMPKAAYIEAISALEEMHLELLAHYKNWLLITDTEEHPTLIANGQKVSPIKTVLTPLPSMSNRESWKWTFDTCGNYLPNHRVELHVESGEGHK